MTVQAVVPKNEVVQKAQEFAAEQNWSTEASAVYVALMNLFAGTGSWLWNSAFMNYTHPVHDLRDALKAGRSNACGVMSYDEVYDLITKHSRFEALINVEA
jgi:hypothetical protein